MGHGPGGRGLRALPRGTEEPGLPWTRVPVRSPPRGEGSESCVAGAGDAVGVARGPQGTERGACRCGGLGSSPSSTPGTHGCTCCGCGWLSSPGFLGGLQPGPGRVRAVHIRGAIPAVVGPGCPVSPGSGTGPQGCLVSRCTPACSSTCLVGPGHLPVTRPGRAAHAALGGERLNRVPVPGAAREASGACADLGKPHRAHCGDWCPCRGCPCGPSAVAVLEVTGQGAIGT